MPRAGTKKGVETWKKRLGKNDLNEDAGLLYRDTDQGTGETEAKMFCNRTQLRVPVQMGKGLKSTRVGERFQIHVLTPTRVEVELLKIKPTINTSY